MTTKDFFPEQVNWRSMVAGYKKSHALKSTWQLLSTLALYIILWICMYFSIGFSYWLTIALSLPAAGLTIRIFIFQHDCGHGSFYKHRKTNDFTGMLCSMFTLIPYHYWKKNHSIHHATAGNLNQRGIGDIYTMTVREYLSLTKWGRFKYRIYRNPLILFFVIPTILFVILYRFPTVRAKVLKPTYPSIFYTNLALGVGVILVWWLIGLKMLLLVQLPITVISSTAGIWLFYIQHQFEDAYWMPEDAWDFTLAALKGSSYFKLPRVLQWFTGNIGFHHIHHLCPKIPNYLLEKCHRENPFFGKVNMFTIRTGIRSVFLTLWDENQKKLVSFRYLKNLILNKENDSVVRG
jgi:omega-6 fatty acid desaturase (delta-12 desaturase)